MVKKEKVFLLKGVEKRKRCETVRKEKVVCQRKKRIPKKIWYAKIRRQVETKGEVGVGHNVGCE